MSDTVFVYINDLILLMNTTPAAAQYVVVVTVIFLFCMLLRKIFTTYVFNLILKLLSKTDTELYKKILLSFEGPMRAFFVILGIFAALLYLPLSEIQVSLTTKVFRTAVIALLTWGFYNLEDVHSILFKKIQERLNVQIDKILFPFLSKFLRVVTVLLAFTIIAQEWDYDINGLIAGLGLGGLAFALAAKDALSNIFGGMVIILDKPFSLGDWIKTPSAEGTVEIISFRSTKIRTFDQALVTVPNATLANESITNRSKMGKRRVTFQLGVACSTPRDKLEGCIRAIKAMLENHNEVHKETIYVSFDKFAESSLDILVYFFTVTTAWDEYLRVKEDVNFKIMEILEREGVSAALPGRSVIIEKSLAAFKKSGS